MTAAAIIGFVEFPHHGGMWVNSDATTLLDATTDYASFICKAPATGTIDKVHVRLGSTTLVGTLSCQIQTLDSGGDPSGTAYGSCTQVDVVVAGTEDNTEITFSGLACSATIGDYICIKIWPTVVTSGSVNVYTTNASGAAQVDGFPYSSVRTSGTGAGTHATVGPGPDIEYSGAVFYHVGWGPAAAYAQESIDNDGSVRRIGNRFILPVPLTVAGCWVQIDNDTDTTTIKLYDTDGTTELATATLVAANRQGTSARLQRVLFGAPVNLSAGTATPYRIVITTSNTSATSAGIIVATIVTAAHMAGAPLGTAMYHTSHNGTDWTDTTTKRAAIGLLVSKFDDGLGNGEATYLMGMGI